MARLTIGFALAVSLYGTYARAESQAEIAARENEEGKELMFGTKYADASAKFRDAVARVPEAKYFFNLCTSLYQEGKFGEALTACNSVDKNNPDDKLKGKNAKLTDKIRTEAKTQGIDLQPTGGGGGDPNVGQNPDPNRQPDPNNPGPDPNNPNNQNPNNQQPMPPPNYAVGRPPTQGLFQAVRPEHNYTWSLGADLLLGGGQIGQKDYYGSSAVGVRFKGDYIVNPASKIGAQGYIGITHLGQGSAQTMVDTLDVFDIGIAGFKHFCPPGMSHVCLTPLIGAQLALLSPANQMDPAGSQVFNYAALGVRAEIDVSYAFGQRFENVISLMLGVNGYSKVFASPSDPSVGPPAATIGLDVGGALAYFGIGYTYRFNTPFGQAPFVTLE
jgi:hypothetical protein